ncbi:porin [Glaciimonas soli]|uniref:Porin n=1 Tax=Glaciimonas soli TaxID=2590999 RepID=A0A843YU63_9BURK|nr:porin [Glaciimonas soli]MQR00871.1 porin [Glaciimonas soli]
MKKLILAASILAGFAGVAQAQTSVTIYGIIDLGLNYTSNVDGLTRVQMASGDVQGSRLGFKGTEDLGNGLSAVFQLENGFSANTGTLGQGGRLFGRQAFVGLSSTTAGTITLGRQYDSIVDYIGPLTSNGNWSGYLFSHPLDNDNTDNSFRINSSLKYTSANYSGFTFGGLYGFGGVAGSANTNNTYSLGASYVNGPLAVAAGFMQLNNPGAPSNQASGSVGNDYNFVASKQKTAGIGINYTFPTATTLGFVYTGTNLDNPTATSYFDGTNTNLLPGGGATLSTLKFTNYELNLKQQITPMFFVGAMYVYTHANYDTSVGQSKLKWNSFGLMADYNLSKRTDIYSQLLFQKVSGDTGSVGSYLGDAYIPGSGGVSDSQQQSLLRIALRHKF